jgi:predicted DNA-binding transcriptional regulator AlpA
VSASHISVRDTCKLLNMSKRAVYSRAGNDRSFPVMIKVIGGGIVFDRSEIDSWALANPRPTAVGVAR